MDKKMSRRITIVTFVMTCVIVLYHSLFGDSNLAVSPGDAQLNDSFLYYLEQVAVLAMSWFFMITGFLLYRDLTMKNYLEKIKRRVFSLLLPYLLWQTIFFIKCLLLGEEGWTPRLLKLLTGGRG